MTLLTVFVGIIAFSNLLLLVAIAMLAFALKGLVEKSVVPAVSEVKSTIHNVNTLVDKVEDKAERIMIIGEETARTVSSKVVATTDLVQETVTSPLINASSILTGVLRAVETWRRASARP